MDPSTLESFLRGEKARMSKVTDLAQAKQMFQSYAKRLQTVMTQVSVVTDLLARAQQENQELRE